MPPKKIPAGIPRRDFLKSAGAAVAALLADPSPVFSGLDFSKLAAAPPLPAHIVENVEIVYELSEHIRFLDTGHVGCAKYLYEFVDTFSRSQRKYRQQVAGLQDEVTPLQMSEIILRHSEKELKTVPRDPVTQKEFIAFAKKVQQGIEYMQMDEGAFLDLLMKKATNGHAVWLKNMRSNLDPNYKDTSMESQTHRDNPERIKSNDNLIALEDILAHSDIQKMLTKTGVQFFSLDAQAIATLANGFKPLTEKMQQQEYSLVIDPMPHTVRSLVRPYIEEYRQKKSETQSKGIS